MSMSAGVEPVAPPCACGAIFYSVKAVRAHVCGGAPREETGFVTAERNIPHADDSRECHPAVDCAHGVPLGLECGAREAGACEAGEKARDTVDAVLAERGSRYGRFDQHAAITQSLKGLLFQYRPRTSLAPDQVEALEMIAHKLGRIVNGDPDYADSWVDIAGYAKLVADRLEGNAR